MKFKEGRLPRIFAGLAVYFDGDAPICDIMDALECTAAPRNIDGRFEFVCGETDAIYAWDIESALNELFSRCDVKRISEVSDQFGGEVWVVVVVYHHEKYPELTFAGKTMETIRELKANISIDAY